MILCMNNLSICYINRHNSIVLKDLLNKYIIINNKVIIQNHCMDISTSISSIAIQK